MSAQRRLSQIASTLFVRNSTLSAATSTCCQAESEKNDVSRNTFRYDTARPYRGLNKAGVIRKKSDIEARNFRSVSGNAERVTNERKYYAYTLKPKKEEKSLSRSRMMKVGDPEEVGDPDQVMALLHGQPEAGRGIQVQFDKEQIMYLKK